VEADLLKLVQDGRAHSIFAEILLGHILSRRENPSLRRFGIRVSDPDVANAEGRLLEAALKRISTSKSVLELMYIHTLPPGVNDVADGPLEDQRQCRTGLLPENLMELPRWRDWPKFRVFFIIQSRITRDRGQFLLGRAELTRIGTCLCVTDYKLEYAIVNRLAGSIVTNKVGDFPQETMAEILLHIRLLLNRNNLQNDRISVGGLLRERLNVATNPVFFALTRQIKNWERGEGSSPAEEILRLDVIVGAIAGFLDGPAPIHTFLRGLDDADVEGCNKPATIGRLQQLLENAPRLTVPVVAAGIT
jgi:hypothetical protein